MGDEYDYDIIIIGGGFAGLTAARELSGQGLSLAVLEARDRLGGRTWFKPWGDQFQEMGGGWVNWTQPHIWAEITRYNLSLFERPGWPKAYDAPLYAWVDGEVVTNTMAENMGQIFPLIAEFANVASEVFPRPFDPHSSMGQIRQYDHLSNEDRLNEMEVTPLQRVLLSRFLAMQCHNHPNMGGYVEFLRWYALAHYNLEIYLSTTARYQFTEGTQALVDALLGDIEADIQLDCPAQAISQDAERVTITTIAGSKVSARQAIVAVPVNVLNAIHFSPALNEGKQALSRERHSGAGQKLFVKVAGHWPHLNCAGDADAPLTTVIVQEATETETLLVVFTVNDKLEPVSKESIQAALQTFVPKIEVIDFVYHNWANDPYALGTWCGYRPGQTSSYLAQAQASEGRLFFAGADLANGWRGFIDGAIESGLRVAGEVKRMYLV
ncbi:MAG: NAD(P)/FAD-dependent oxidoreductase [Chloroflexota bacterium]